METFFKYLPTDHMSKGDIFILNKDLGPCILFLCCTRDDLRVGDHVKREISDTEYWDEVIVKFDESGSPACLESGSWTNTCNLFKIIRKATEEEIDKYKENERVLHNSGRETDQSI